MFDPYNARTSLVRYILPLFVLVVMVVMLQMMLDMRSRASALKAEACEESDFRQQHVTPGLYRSIWKAALVEGTGADGFANILTATMLNSGFYPRQVRADSVPYRKYKPEEYERLMEAYQSVWSDLKYFPIPSTEEKLILKIPMVRSGIMEACVYMKAVICLDVRRSLAIIRS